MGVHTKACVEALGIKDAVQAIAEASISDAIVWAGMSGEYLNTIELLRERAVGVRSVALPKLTMHAANFACILQNWMLRLQGTGAAAASLIFADLRCDQPTKEERRALFAGACTGTIPLIIENNGRRDEWLSAPHQLASLLDELPSCGIALDLGHAAACGRFSREFAMLRRRVAWVEVHDNDGEKDLHLPLGSGSGRGSFDIGLGDLGWTPTDVFIETDARLGANRGAWTEAIRSDVAQLRQCLKTLEDRHVGAK
ncbi:hypothetical protein [Bradyrhizobium liaoningense]